MWVIAETRDLPVRYIKSVVTDDRGRYVVPDLPKASYSVWARGYGLVDSAKATSRAGPAARTITATPAPNEAAAAHYYPAIYWYSMLKIPGRRSVRRQERHSRTAHADRLAQRDEEQRAASAAISSASCPRGRSRRRSARSPRSPRPGSAACSPGQSGAADVRPARTASASVAFSNYGDWTDRIAKGELPHAKPPRPQGVERNIVVTLRDWMNEKHYLHDLIASDRRYPDRQRLRPAATARPSTAPTRCRSSIRSRTWRRRSARRCAMPSMPLSLGPGHAAALDAAAAISPTGATNGSGTRASTTTTRCSVATAGCGWPPTIRGHRQSGVLQAGVEPSVGQGVPAGTRRPATSRCSIRRRRSTRSSTPASARTTCSSATTPTTRCGRAAAVRWSAGSTPRCSTRPVTRRSRRAGRRWSSTPMATASATPMSSPISRSIRPRTRASTPASTR